LALDDCQWADSGSVSLLQLLMTQESLPVLIILSYRNNEVDESHPLSKLLAVTRLNTPAQLTEVQLRPLSALHVTQLLSDTFRCPEEKAAPLAALLSTKTQGNAFFLQTMLRSFNKSGLVHFDVVRGEWEWDLEAIRLVPVPDDVVDVLCAQIRTMPPDTQHLLQYAACSGSLSNLHSLHVITKLPLLRLVRSACEAERAGLLLTTTHAQDLRLLLINVETMESGVPTSSSSSSSSSSASSSVPSAPTTTTMMSSSTVSDSASSSSPSPSLEATLVAPSSAVASATASPAPPSSTTAAAAASSVAMQSTKMLSSINLRFVHDKIQLAAFKLIPADQLSLLHCTIAEQLFRSIDGDETLGAEYATDVASHVNQGFIDPELHLLDDAAADAAVVAGVVPAPFPSPSPSSSPSTMSASSAVSCNAESIERWRLFFADTDVVERVVDLEAEAGRQATAAATYDVAVRFFSCALQLLQFAHKREHMMSDVLPAESAISPATAAASSGPPLGDWLRLPSSSWSRAFSTCTTLYSELCKSLLLHGLHEQAQQCVEYALAHMTTLEVRAPLFEMHVIALSQQMHMQEALDAGLRHLSEFGITLCDSLSPELAAWIYDVHESPDGVSGGYPQHPVFALDEMKDPFAMQLAGSLVPMLFFLKSPLFWNCTITMLQMTKEKGIAPESALAFALFAMCIWSKHQYREQWLLGQVSQRILDHYGEAARSMQPRTHWSDNKHKAGARETMRKQALDFSRSLLLCSSLSAVCCMRAPTSGSFLCAPCIVWCRLPSTTAWWWAT
jgi:hypothetical protein